MKNILRSYIYLFLVVFTVHCNAQISDNYRRILPPKSDVKDTFLDSKVRITLTSKMGSPPENSAKLKTLFDLTEKGQKALIEAYSKIESKDAKKFRDQLIRPLEVKKIVKQIINKNHLKIFQRLDFLVTDKWIEDNPYNRIASIRIAVNLKPNSEVKFKGFKDFQTNFENVSLGSVENTSVRNFSLGAGVGSSSSDTTNTFDTNGNNTGIAVSGLTPSINGSFSSSNTNRETLDLTRRIIPRTGSISESQMIVYMEGAPDRNLNHSISIELELEPQNVNIQNFEVIKFSVDKMKVAKLTPSIILVPHLTNDIKADISYDWLYRKIERRGRSKIEGKHVIRYYSRSGAGESDKVILKKSDVNIDLWQFKFLDNAGNKQEVFIKNAAVKYRLLFDSQDNAIELLYHLDEKGINKIGNFEIIYGTSETTLPTNKISSLIIEKG